MELKNLRSADMLTGIILALGSLAVLYDSYKMTVAVTARGNPLVSSPGFVPAVIAVFMLILGFVLLRAGQKSGGSLTFLLPSRLAAGLASAEGRNVITILGIIAGYIFILLKFLPYSIATFIFLYAFILFYYQRRHLRVALIAAGVSLVITVAFGELASIPLPGKSLILYLGGVTVEIP